MMEPELVLVRNRHTGLEKMVPPGTAEMMKNEAMFMKDWEVPKPGSPTPHEVIKFQEKKGEIGIKADKRYELKKAEAKVEKLKAELEDEEVEEKGMLSDKEDESVEIRAWLAKKGVKHHPALGLKKLRLLKEEAEIEEKAEAKEDLSVLSVSQLNDKLEYLTTEQLDGLKKDERKTVKAMADKELKKREDENKD